ncbi:hypothetical protein T492DRAFT_841341 [Pavlovales sp. CCMP2436]|nr:hypothetical protein T492DRAFT_841341 [Pavlovales sp. CCMP2436]
MQWSSRQMDHCLDRDRSRPRPLQPSPTWQKPEVGAQRRARNSKSHKPPQRARAAALPARSATREPEPQPQPQPLTADTQMVAARVKTLSASAEPHVPAADAQMVPQPLPQPLWDTPKPCVHANAGASAAVDASATAQSESYVGCRVRKHFAPHGWFVGYVTYMLPEDEPEVSHIAGAGAGAPGSGGDLASNGANATSGGGGASGQQQPSMVHHVVYDDGDAEDLGTHALESWLELKVPRVPLKRLVGAAFEKEFEPYGWFEGQVRIL